jgi:hypothetical protein
VDDSDGTGDRPRVHVRVCVAASDGDQYWIVSVSGGDFYAKTSISGRVSLQHYTVELLNGSGAPGENRDFVVVAARSGSARNRLQQNKDADRNNEPFDRGELPSGAEEVSERFSTTS